MNYSKYSITPNHDFSIFDFKSVSNEKIILKKVIFSLIPNTYNYYNLALVDVLEDGNYDDLSISNNNDLKEILSTVYQCIQLFLNQNQQSIVLFAGSSASRTRLYRIAISQNLTEASDKFEIKGFINDTFEDFKPNRAYELFSISLKTKQ